MTENNSISYYTLTCKSIAQMLIVNLLDLSAIWIVSCSSIFISTLVFKSKFLEIADALLQGIALSEFDRLISKAPFIRSKGRSRSSRHLSRLHLIDLIMVSWLLRSMIRLSHITGRWLVSIVLQRCLLTFSSIAILVVLLLAVLLLLLLILLIWGCHMILMIVVPVEWTVWFSDRRRGL